MKNYEDTFNSIPSSEELNLIKLQLSDDTDNIGWENYYWAAKCLCVYDDELDAEFICSLMNRAIKYGLSYRLDPERYLDAMKVLATLNSQLGNYEAVLNYLSTLIEYDESAPDWVFHDFVTAQIHTDNIRRILRRPKMFLSDLSKNDEGSDEVKNRQKRIFKDFLVEAIKYLELKSDAEVDEQTISKAARGYNLIGTDGWKAFTVVVNGGEVEKSKKKDDRPFIVSLFPEDEVPVSKAESEIEKKYEALFTKLEKIEQELEKKYLELEEKEASQKERELQGQIESAAQENEELKRQIESLKKEKEEKLKKIESDTPAEIVSNVHLFLFTTQSALAKWLDHNLPYCADDWWDKCVMGSLSYEQRARAHDGRFTSLKEFDLAALLRIMRKNWQRLQNPGGLYLAESDWDCLQKMFEVRNRWAHVNVDLPDKEIIKEDLYTISEFMIQIRCSQAMVKEVTDYARRI